ncbi:MAG: Fur family transcriptional regulator [Mariprofundus sp.]|nr:Fur family transcriptional regulator [Mariprofundus sp.]
MSTLQSIPTLLRSHGLRVTPQRLAVAELVLEKPIHITARTAYETLRSAHPAISMNTIYLTLGQFESSGLLSRFEVGGNTVFDSNTSPHHHAFCKRCKAIIDLNDEQKELPRLPAALEHWHIDHEQRILSGTCPQCIEI